MSNLYSLAIGVGTKNSSGEWLEVFYPAPLLNPDQTLSDIFSTSLGLSCGDIEPSRDQLATLHSALNHHGFSELASTVEQLAASSRPVVAVLLTEDSAPNSVPQGYLKLQLLSHRLVRPHGTDLTGIFGVLKNVAWTNAGAIDIEATRSSVAGAHGWAAALR